MLFSSLGNLGFLGDLLVAEGGEVTRNSMRFEHQLQRRMTFIVNSDFSAFSSAARDMNLDKIFRMRYNVYVYLYYTRDKCACGSV